MLFCLHHLPLSCDSICRRCDRRLAVISVTFVLDKDNSYLLACFHALWIVLLSVTLFSNAFFAGCKKDQSKHQRNHVNSSGNCRAKYEIFALLELWCEWLHSALYEIFALVFFGLLLYHATIGTQIFWWEFPTLGSQHSSISISYQ